MDGCFSVAAWFRAATQYGREKDKFFYGKSFVQLELSERGDLCILMEFNKLKLP